MLLYLLFSQANRSYWLFYFALSYNSVNIAFVGYFNLSDENLTIDGFTEFIYPEIAEGDVSFLVLHIVNVLFWSWIGLLFRFVWMFVPFFLCLDLYLSMFLFWYCLVHMFKWAKIQYFYVWSKCILKPLDRCHWPVVSMFFAS